MADQEFELDISDIFTSSCINNDLLSVESMIGNVDDLICAKMLEEHTWDVCNNDILKCIINNYDIPLLKILSYVELFLHNEEISTMIIDKYNNVIKENMQNMLESDINVLIKLIEYYSEDMNIITTIILHIFHSSCVFDNNIETLCEKCSNFIGSFNDAFQILLNEKPYHYVKIITILSTLLNNNMIVDISANDHMLFTKICTTYNVELINTICAYYGDIYDTVNDELIIIPIVKTSKRKRDVGITCDTCCEDSNVCTKCWHTICARCISAPEVRKCPTCRSPISYFHVIT